MKGKSRKGTVLILALWSLGLLVVFALAIGMRIQQKITLTSRLEKRAQLYYAAEAGIKRAVSLLKKDLAQQRSIRKTVLFNAPSLFKGIPLGSLFFDVGYGAANDSEHPSGVAVYGIVDEERKININNCDRSTLENLFRIVAGASREKAGNLA